MEPDRPPYSDWLTRFLGVNALIDTRGARRYFIWWVKVTAFFTISLSLILILAMILGNLAHWHFEGTGLGFAAVMRAAIALAGTLLALFGTILGLAVVVIPVARRYDERNASK